MTCWVVRLFSNCFSIGFDFVFTFFRNVFVCVLDFLIVFKLFLNWVGFGLVRFRSGCCWFCLIVFGCWLLRFFVLFYVVLGC